jgi:protein-L-isoaspartate(D-aspartate) O-methyltransferase
MEAVCLHRQGQDQWLTESLFETDVPRLIGAEDIEQFEF